MEETPNGGNVPGGTKMTRIHRLTVIGLVLVGGLMSAGRVSAGPLADWLGCGNCPPPDYSPLRYWTPGAARVYDCVHGSRLSMYATNLHPDIPPTTYILEYPCPPADPAQTLIPIPTPPPTSRFRY